MQFPYERYITLADASDVSDALTTYYPTGEETYARWVAQTIAKASQLLSQLFGQSMPEMELLLVASEDWSLAPREPGENNEMFPYWTDVRAPSVLVVPVEVDAIFSEATPEKLAFMLYQVLSLVFLEDDPRPWPENCPLWADEWQIKFAACWLFRSLHGQQGVINTDLFAQNEEIFEPEEDGKTPVTVRGFDWFEDTSAEDYLSYDLLLEQFAVDLLDRYDSGALSRFLTLYRTERPVLLSDEITLMLGSALGPDGVEWLEELVYF